MTTAIRQVSICSWPGFHKLDACMWGSWLGPYSCCGVVLCSVTSAVYVSCGPLMFPEDERALQGKCWGHC